MSENQKSVIGLITRFLPADFGVKSAYFKIVDKNIEIVFFVEKKNASISISYLNSLSNLVGKEIETVDIGSNVYIYKGTESTKNIEREKDYQKIKLPTFERAGLKLA